MDRVVLLFVLVFATTLGMEAAEQEEAPPRMNLQADAAMGEVNHRVVLTASETPFRWLKSGGSWCRGNQCEWRSYGDCVGPTPILSEQGRAIWVSERAGIFRVGVVDAIGRRTYVTIEVTDPPVP